MFAKAEKLVADMVLAMLHPINRHDYRPYTGGATNQTLSPTLNNEMNWMNENMKWHEAGGDRKVESVGGILGKREEPEKILKNPDIDQYNWLSGKTEMQTREGSNYS